MVAAIGAALRPMLPADVPALTILYRASIELLAEEDYSEDQREAWAARADEPAFAKRLASGLTLVAIVGNRPAGFASMEGTDKIGMLYVDPEYARQGVATLLVDALVKLAGARGVSLLKVDASDTAQPLFQKLGFVATVRNMVSVGDEWLGNTSLERKLAAVPPKVGKP